MKTINIFINEKLKISSKSNVYTCQPKDKFELRKILEERLKEDKNADLNDIDVSQITDMGWREMPRRYGLFEHLDPHNIDISEWNVSNVTNMDSMFYKCKNFNADLSNWNVSKVENIKYMFYECENFNCDLSKWYVSKVTNMSGTFYECKNFIGKGLENWDVSKVTDMQYMFDGCTKFNSNLSNWNVSKVRNMSSMFKDCKSLKNTPNWSWDKT